MARSPLPFSLTMRARPTVPPAPARLKTSGLVASLLVFENLRRGAGRGVVAAAGGVGHHDPQPGEGAAPAPVVAGPAAGLPVAPQPEAIRAMPAATAATRNALNPRMLFLFSLIRLIGVLLMLGPKVTRLTLV